MKCESQQFNHLFAETKFSISIRNSVDWHDNIRDLLKIVKELFEFSDNALANTHTIKFSSMFFFII